MQLTELAGQVEGFDRSAAKEKIKLFAWWLHSHGGKNLFSPADIRKCFSELHVAEPAALATYVSRMAESGDLLKERGQYKLGRMLRVELDGKYGVHQSMIAISKILSDLPAHVPKIVERSFLAEALRCYRAEAYRSCIVMTWNLAYSHLLDWILDDSTRLAVFNSAIIKRYPKKNSLVMSRYDDFSEELKEREVVEICATAGLITSNVTKLLREKLDRRNMAAHPSGTVVVQSQADDAITDLVHNVILSL